MYFYKYKLLKKGNNYIKTLIIVSAIALIGLISIQSYWILNGIEQQQKHHQNIIKLSLAEIADELEKHESLKKAKRNDGLEKSSENLNLKPSITDKITEIIKFQDSLVKEHNYQIEKEFVK